MTTNELYKYLTKKFGKGEKQQFLKWDKMVKKPIRITKLLANERDINDLYFILKTSLDHKIIWTEKGCIARDLDNALGVYDVHIVKNSANNVIKGIIFTIILNNTVWVIKCGRLTNREDNTMSGKKAFAILKKELEKDGVKLSDYEEEDGIEYKEQIDDYPIMNVVLKREIEHVNHIDLNQAWPSALAAAMPEFEKTFARLDKKVLNSALGYCQSKYCGYRLSRLPMIGINDTNKVIDDLTDKLVDNDFLVVGYNTDGIWYIDRLHQNRLYHDDNEGKGLHHWKHDWVDVKFYAQSNGQYYFIPKSGKIEYRLRGYYQYETIKPREEWDTTDDFFKAIASAVEVTWDDKRGLLVRSL